MLSHTIQQFNIRSLLTHFIKLETYLFKKLGLTSNFYVQINILFQNIFNIITLNHVICISTVTSDDGLGIQNIRDAVLQKSTR